MSEVLVISYWYYPENTARSFHAKGIVNALIKNGYKVHLLLPYDDIFKNKLHDSNNLTIHLIKPGFLLHKNKRRWDTNRKMLYDSNNNIFKMIIKKIYNYVIWPDRTIEWAVNVYRYVKDKKLYKKCLSMVTIGLPISSHITGYLIKKICPQINWVADYGDPFSFNTDRIARPYDKFLEKIIIKDVDSIVIPTENAMECYTGLGVKRSKIHVIPQLFQKEYRESDYLVDKRKFNIMYAGSFYKGIRNPVEFIYGLILASKISSNIVFHYFGNVTALEEFLKSENIDISTLPIIANPYRDRSEIISIMQKMDLLINLNNTSTIQVPSKIIDYLQADKTILNIGSFMYEKFENVENDREKIALKLIELSNTNLDHDYSDIISLYDYDLNSKKYINLIKGT